MSDIFVQWKRFSWSLVYFSCKNAKQVIKKEKTERTETLLLVLNVIIKHWRCLALVFLSAVTIKCEVNERDKHLEAAVMITCWIQQKGNLELYYWANIFPICAI